ncbi:YesL family protein [Gracilibacillus timonensis]|uniref:YesL family protein n=1 Tax=Gracilibacillus timonensis TaxID=1816696 RepID=UPI000825CB3D|nr:DUF624 domain-containing protein [Gracilibacillus timonensis]
MELGGFIGVIYKISLWITRLTTVNLLWFFFNLPIWFFVYNLLLVETVSQLVLTGIIIFILSPLLLFPATTAMFAIVRKWVMGDEINILSSFWRYYREEYKKSILGGFVFVFIWTLLAINCYFYLNTNENGLFLAFFILLTFILFVISLQFFSIIVHAQTTLFTALKNAMFFTLGNPILTIELSLISGLFIYISLKEFTFLIPFFTGAIISYFAFSGFYRKYKKLDLLAR